MSFVHFHGFSSFFHEVSSFSMSFHFFARVSFIFPLCFLMCGSIFDIFSHDFGLGVVFVCDCFDRILKVLFVTVAVVVAVVVAVDFPARGRAGEKKTSGGRGVMANAFHVTYTKVLLFSIVWIDCEFWREKKNIKNNTGVQVQQKQEEKQKQKHKQQQHQVQNRAKQ